MPDIAGNPRKIPLNRKIKLYALSGGTMNNHVTLRATTRSIPIPSISIHSWSKNASRTLPFLLSIRYQLFLSYRRDPNLEGSKVGKL